MVPENPQVPRVRRRFVGREGNLIRIAQSILLARVEQPRQRLGVESEEPKIVVVRLQLTELKSAGAGSSSRRAQPSGCPRCGRP